MSANIVSIDRLLRRSRDWSAQELAEFYRVESALVQAGLNIDTERGLSDEGEPWFAFCRRGDGEVIVHIARIGGFYTLAGPGYEEIAHGPDIGTLVRDLITRHPLVHVPGNKRGSPSKIFLHPAALLAAVVATAFFKSSEARALTDSDPKATDDKVNDGRAATIRFAASKGAENANAAAMLNAAEHAAIIIAIITALQATSGEHGQDPSRAVSSASDLIDLGALPPAAVHEAARLPPPVVGGGAELGTHISVHLPRQVAALGTLPVGTVSVGVSADRSVQSPSGSHVSDSPPASDGAAVTLESSILRADAVPHIQAAKSGSGAKVVIEDRPTKQDNISRQPDLQPAAVTHAPQTASRSAVEIASANGNPPQATGVTMFGVSTATPQNVSGDTGGFSGNITGLTKVSFQSGSNAQVILGTPTGGGTNAALQTVNVNANQNFIGWIAAAALAGASNAVTVNITGSYGAAGAAKNIVLGNDAGVPRTAATPMNAYETETISATGPTFVQLSNGTTGALSTTTFVLTGAGALELSANAKGDLAKVMSIDATGNLGGVAITGALNIGATIVGGKNDAVTAGLLNGNTALTSFKGGSGNDFIDLTSLNLAQVNAMTTLDGGGDRDTVIYVASVLNTATALKSTGFEIVGSGAGLTGTVNWANLGVGVDTVQLFGTAGGDVTFNNVPTGATVAFGVFSNAKDYTFNGPGGTTNVLNVTETAHNGTDFGNLTFKSFEVVNFTITDTTGVAQVNNIKMTPDIGGGATLNLVANGTGTGVNVDVEGTTNVTATGAIHISGTDQGIYQLEGLVTAALLDATGFAGGRLVMGASTTSINTTAGGATGAITILGTPQNDILIGSNSKDTISAGAGNDIIANHVNLGNPLTDNTENDQIFTGSGTDRVNLFGDTAGAGGTLLTTALGQIPFVADFATGTDIVELSFNVNNYNGMGNTSPQYSGINVGGTVVQYINPGMQTVGANTDILHLGSFNEIVGQSIGEAFLAALTGGGATTVNGFAAGGNTIFFTMYDLTRGQMLIGDVDTIDSALIGTVTEASTVHLIGALTMTQLEYIAFSGAGSFQIIA
jgi:RTX calcium-binding nonapeptide repeat (4 copies)